MDQAAHNPKHNPRDKGSYFQYYHFRLPQAVSCDLDFRKYMACNLASTHVVPIKSGPALKLTSEGVIRLLGGVDYPLLASPTYKGLAITFQRISQDEYDATKRSTSNKIYFKGFPPGIGLQDVVSVFSRFGFVQYVFIMKGKTRNQGKFGHGYFFFSNRQEVENLLCYGGKLYFNEFRIRYEEFKSTMPKKRNSLKTQQQTKECQLSHSEYFKIENFSSIENNEIETTEHKPKETIQSQSYAKVSLGKEFLQPRVSSGLFVDKGGNPTCVQRRPYLRSTSKVGINLTSSDNLRFNIKGALDPGSPLTFVNIPKPPASNSNSSLPQGSGVYYLKQS